jgi:hypothetical protein
MKSKRLRLVDRSKIDKVQVSCPMFLSPTVYLYEDSLLMTGNDQRPVESKMNVYGRSAPEELEMTTFVPLKGVYEGNREGNHVLDSPLQPVRQ